MKLFWISVAFLVLQLFVSYLMRGSDKWMFFLSMAVCAYFIFIVITCFLSRQDDAAKMLAIIYFTAESYMLFISLASTSFFYENSPILYEMLNSFGQTLMYFLSILTLVVSGLTPILHKSGKFGDAVGHFIRSTYNGVVSLPLHRSGY